MQLPKITLVAGDESINVDFRKVDMIRLERAEKISIERMHGGMDFMYKMVWLALQRTKHPLVSPHVDLAQLDLAKLCDGADSLADLADIESNESEPVEVGKVSDPVPSTGE